MDSVYAALLKCADHPRSLWILGALAFCGSIFFPFPPDPLFALVALRRPTRIPVLVGVCAVCATLGGMVMYGIGAVLYESWGKFLLGFYGWDGAFVSLRTQVHTWGFLALLIKAFVPCPYKLVALTLGVCHFPLESFVLGSVLGRGLRYGLAGLFIWKTGPQLQALMDVYAKPLLAAFVVLVLGGLVVLKFL